MDVKMQQLAGHPQSTYDYKTDNVEGLIIARYYNYNSVSNVLSFVLSYILPTPIQGLTQEWFRDVSFSMLACVVYERLHIYPVWDILLPLPMAYTPY